jgi:hypothetical protein
MERSTISGGETQKKNFRIRERQALEKNIFFLCLRIINLKKIFKKKFINNKNGCISKLKMYSFQILAKFHMPQKI